MMGSWSIIGAVVVVPDNSSHIMCMGSNFLTWVGVLMQSELAGSLERRWVLKGKNRDVEKKEQNNEPHTTVFPKYVPLLMLRMPKLQLSSSFV